MAQFNLSYVDVPQNINQSTNQLINQSIYQSIGKWLMINSSSFCRDQTALKVSILKLHTLIICPMSKLKGRITVDGSDLH